ncbi:MAG: NAD+ kinase [Spirochaetae bacterium HGW-Spirochaetae-10]|nr:MAG: NAD+ kinase [Spirochaetae bacterium HGW-Spirochaetae-10]
MSQMQQKDFLICMKRTKWQRDVERFGSAREARRIYRLQNNIFRRVYGSHLRQLESIELLQRGLGDRADFIYREDLSPDLVMKYGALVSLGGDNHFIYVARFAGIRPLIGINSDPRTSSGALVHFTTQSFLECTQNPRFPDRFETWTMIEGQIHHPDGKTIATGPCISETGIRNAFADAMSRYYIRINDEPWEEQKSSGLLLSTGAGSTGWFHNCLPHTMQIYEDPTFARDEQIFRFVAREPGFHKQHYYRYLYRTLNRGDTLEIISEMDGEIIVDAQPETSYAFGPGFRAEFRLSDDHLLVALP